MKLLYDMTPLFSHNATSYYTDSIPSGGSYTCLLLQQNTTQTHTQEAISQEAIVRKKADNARAKKDEIELARDTTVEDLTKGLLNYRFTGLTFKRSEQGAIRYVDVSYMHMFHTFVMTREKRNLEYYLTKLFSFPNSFTTCIFILLPISSYFLPKLIVSSLLNLPRMIQHVNSTLH